MGLWIAVVYVLWIGVCAVAWDVERCVMWNEAPRVWAATWRWRYARCDKWWDVECGGVLMLDVECYVKHVSGMWNWV